MKYYRLTDDIYFENRWYLGDILNVDNWQFTAGIGIACTTERFHIEIYQNGKAMDFTTNEAYSIPIVSEKVKNQLSKYKEIQFLNAKIKGLKSLNYVFIMVVTSKLECVNETHSVFTKFTDNDPIRPDLAGQYYWFAKLVLDKKSIFGHHIFRISKAINYLIISEDIKNELEQIGITGVVYTEVETI